MHSGAITTRWPIVTVRAFAALSVLLGALGMAFVVDGLFRLSLRGHTLDLEPYYSEVFLIKTSINFVCLVALWVAAVFLWKVERKGLWLANVVFSSEIFYVVVIDSWIGLSLMMSENERAQAIGHAMGATGGTGNMGIAPQIITGFPVVALILLNLAYSRLHGKKIS